MQKDLQPQRTIMVMEGFGQNHREAAHAEYKSERKPFPDAFKQQIPVIEQFCDTLGVHVLRIDPHEADDVIASFCLQKSGTRVVFTTDKDIISLVRDNLWVYTKEKGRGKLLECADIQAKWGVPPERIPDVLMLCGDAIDTIPGIMGIGEKTATALVQQFGSATAVFEHLEQVPERIRKKLEAGVASFKLSQQLVQLHTNILLPELVPLSPNWGKAIELARFYGMQSIAQRWADHLIEKKDDVAKPA
jgi:DNA polymerase-1